MCGFSLGERGGSRADAVAVGQATGDRLMDKIEFEEWALKAIDPALSPKPWKAIANGSDGMKEARESEEGKVSGLALCLGYAGGVRV